MLQVQLNSITNNVVVRTHANTLQSVISRLPLVDHAAINQQQQQPVVAVSSSSATSATPSKALQLPLPDSEVSSHGRATIIE
jgi:hypothetical protein